jgi:hypothetical protein
VLLLLPGCSASNHKKPDPPQYQSSANLAAVVGSPVLLLTLQGDRAGYWTGTGRLTVTDQDQKTVMMDAVLLIQGNERARLRTWKLGRVMMDVLYANGRAMGTHDRRVPKQGLVELAEAMPMLTAMLNQHVALNSDVIHFGEMPFSGNTASPQEKVPMFEGIITSIDGRLHFKRLTLTRNARTLDFQWDRVELTESAPSGAWDKPGNARLIVEGLDPIPLAQNTQPPAIEELPIDSREPAS